MSAPILPATTTTTTTPRITSTLPTAASTVPPSRNPSPSPPPDRSSRVVQRFVMNKVEKAWILTQLMALGAPVQTLKTLDATCAHVADSVHLRHVPDSTIIAEQQQYGISWRRSYMNRITTENVRHVANIVPEMAKKVPISSMTGSENDGPVAAPRGSENDAQHVLNQLVLDYKEESTKRVLTTDEDANRALIRNRESRVEKEKRNREWKESFERNKKRRSDLREARERRRMAADVQNLHAQTRIANVLRSSSFISLATLARLAAFAADFALAAPRAAQT